MRANVLEHLRSASGKGLAMLSVIMESGYHVRCGRAMGIVEKLGKTLLPALASDAKCATDQSDESYLGKKTLAC